MATLALILNNGGIISTATESAGKAGTVQISAGTLLVDGALSSINAKAASGSSGQTGSVTVQATDKMTISNGGAMSIQNEATVINPGELTPTLLTVTAPNIAIDGGLITATTTGNVAAGIVKLSTNSLAIGNKGSVSSDTSGVGKAGDVDVAVVGNFAMTTAGQVSSSTAGSGNAGTVKVSAATLMVDGDSTSINARAKSGSSGQTGSVTVQATDKMTISNGGTLSIQNDATVTNPASLRVCE